MKQNDNEATPPMIVRYSTSLNNGIEQQHISRHAIGYVVRGDKYIYLGDKCLHAKRGDIFFLGEGIHHIEDVSERYSHFEQILFYFSSDELKHIITTFNISHNLEITNNHCCAKCRSGNAITMKAPHHLSSFFKNAINYIYDDEFTHDPAAESIKLTELVYLITSHEDCCLKYKLIECIDTDKSTFEQIVYANTFNDIPIERLADLCNRSLTSFKKEFKRVFDTSPHQWFLRQRLSHSRLLLISTRRSVAEIGVECAFPNTSHFIKLFKRCYKSTPSVFRQEYLELINKQNQTREQEKEATEEKEVDKEMAI